MKNKLIDYEFLVNSIDFQITPLQAKIDWKCYIYIYKLAWVVAPLMSVFERRWLAASSLRHTSGRVAVADIYANKLAFFLYGLVHRGGQDMPIKLSRVIGVLAYIS